MKYCKIAVRVYFKWKRNAFENSLMIRYAKYTQGDLELAVKVASLNSLDQNKGKIKIAKLH